MSNNNVQAAAEGLPSTEHTMSSETRDEPALAAAMATTGEKDELSQLIEKCRKLTEDGNRADEAHFAIYHRDDRPPIPFVLANEFPYIVFPLRHSEYNSKASIDKVIDDHIAERRRFYEMCAEAQEGGLVQWQVEKLARTIQEAEAHRERLHELFGERQAVFEEWSEASGYGAADAALTAIWDELSDLQDKVLAFPCATLSELAAKAAYIVAEWGDEFPQTRQHQFIREVAKFASRDTTRYSGQSEEGAGE